MSANRILDQLRHQIHCLEDSRRRFSRTISITETVDRWLPHGGLPTACIHEVKGTNLAAAIAFAAILSTRSARDQGNILYIAPDHSLYPLGLLPYGVALDRILHISARRPQDLAWTVMEALRCPQVSSVIAVIAGLDLTESRRLQLAAETSGATGFFLGDATSAPIASPITRWKITAAIGQSRQRFDQPVWALDLLYCRGGRPGKWILEWRDQKLNAILFTAPAKHAAREALAE